MAGKTTKSCCGRCSISKSGIANMPEQDAFQFGWRFAHGAGSTVERVQWYVNRLQCMTRAEILHRALRALASRGERWGLLGGTYVPAPDLRRESRPWISV